MSAQEALAWEAERRPRAAAAAFAAGGLTILGAILSAIAQGRVPKFDDRVLTVVDTLRLATRGEEIPGGRLSAVAQYVGDNATVPIVASVTMALGGLLIFFPLAYLYRATRARRPQLAQMALIAAAAGAVGFGLGTGVARVAYYVGAIDFTGSADRSNSAAAEALSGSTFVVGQILALVGQFALGLAFVLIALNAMRVGLLTRFMGVLGVIVGATFVLPLDQIGIIRSFWLGALGALLLGRWPTGVPKAWQTGEAAPWPTQQELREQRQAARGGGRREAAPPPREERRRPAAAPPAPEPTAPAHPSSRKRKRKRRT